MPGQTCIVCQLPSRLRDELDALGRRGISLRARAALAAERGHPEILKDSLHRHQQHAVKLEVRSVPADSDAGLSVAVIVADVLQRWPSLANELSARLASEGLEAAAAVTAAAAPGSMRAALDAAHDAADVSELLKARALTRALGAVLPRHHSAAADLGAQLDREGLTDLADAVRELIGTDGRLYVVEGVSGANRTDQPVQELRSLAEPRRAAVRAPQPTSEEIGAPAGGAGVQVLDLVQEAHRGTAVLDADDLPPRVIDLRSARAIGDDSERARALADHERRYGSPNAQTINLAVYGTTSPPGSRYDAASPGAGRPTQGDNQ